MSAVVVELPVALSSRVALMLVRSGASGFQEEDGSEPLLRWVVLCPTLTGAQGLVTALRKHLIALSVSDRQAVRVRTEQRQVGDWATAWIQTLEPVQLTPSIRVDPTRRASPDLRTLVLEPRMAFGYGEHPSTRLAAVALESWCRRLGGARVLDVGTGSGILGLIAAKSGAGTVLGIDTSEEAVAAAKRNATLNRLERCRFRCSAVHTVSGEFDVVVANIEAEVLEALAPLLVDRLARYGVLILSGFIEQSVPDLRARYSQFGLLPARRHLEDDWVALELRRMTHQ